MIIYSNGQKITCVTGNYEQDYHVQINEFCVEAKIDKIDSLKISYCDNFLTVGNIEYVAAPCDIPELITIPKIYRRIDLTQLCNLAKIRPENHEHRDYCTHLIFDGKHCYSTDARRLSRCEFQNDQIDEPFYCHKSDILTVCKLFKRANISIQKNEIIFSNDTQRMKIQTVPATIYPDIQSLYETNGYQTIILDHKKLIDVVKKVTKLYGKKETPLISIKSKNSIVTIETISHEFLHFKDELRTDSQVDFKGIFNACYILDTLKCSKNAMLEVKDEVSPMFINRDFLIMPCEG
jgi:DNA polymerase III sliding clamp (beta) subunit (PCNA family)